MRQIISLIKQKKAAIERQISELEAKLAKAEPGKLEIKLNHGKKRFARYITGTSKYEYLGQSKLDTIKALSQKRYDTELLKILKNLQVSYQKCLKILESPSNKTQVKSVYDDLPSEIKQFVKQNIITHEGYIKEWQNKSYSSLNLPPDLPYSTAKGERVRSKSEIIIADRLNLAGVPYHYEYPVDLKFTTLYPDFLVLNTRTLKTYAWEHLGMLDDPDYATRSKEKLELYARGNAFPGKNLIVTFETSKSPLSTDYVDALIEQYLK